MRKKEKAVAILTDLSKAFESLDHKLLIAKLDAYGFGKGSLELISSYLSFRKQRLKINNFFSDWGNVTSGVPQGVYIRTAPIQYISSILNECFHFNHKVQLRQKINFW